MKFKLSFKNAMKQTVKVDLQKTISMVFNYKKWTQLTDVTYLLKPYI